MIKLCKSQRTAPGRTCFRRERNVIDAKTIVTLHYPDLDYMVITTLALMVTLTLTLLFNLPSSNVQREY